MTTKEIFDNYVCWLKEKHEEFVARKDSKETMEIIEKIRSKTGGSFVGEDAMSTLLGYCNEYDDHGRCLTPNPNWVTSHVEVDGVRYTIVQHGWKAFIFDRNVKGLVSDEAKRLMTAKK